MIDSENFDQLVRGEAEPDVSTEQRLWKLTFSALPNVPNGA